MIYLIIFILGLFIGSFLNVLVDRLPINETVISGRSHCEKCKTNLAWYDLIPVISFVLLKGKCRYCKAKLSIYYPVIEVTTGAVFISILFFLKSDPMLYVIYSLFMASTFVVIFFTDLKSGIIPDKIILWAIGISLFYFIFISPQGLQNHILSAFGGALFFMLISAVYYFLTKKIAFGGGDLKLGFVAGLFLGWPNIFLCLYLAFLTGGAISIILILWRKKRFLNDTLPFAPFLIIGLFLSLYFGNLINKEVIMYLGL